MNRRVVMRLGRITSIVAAALSAGLASSTSAWADPGFSSIIISHALPGMYEAPPGPSNGPLTESGIRSALSEVNANADQANGAATLGKAIDAGDINAYIRTWINEPPNGAFVEVIALHFPSSDDAAIALAGTDAAAKTNAFGHFAVPEIPHSIGATMIINSKLGVVSEQMVWFAKGPNLFDVMVGQVTTAANSGAPGLGEADVIQIASHQANFAPGSPIAPSTDPGGSTNNVFYVAGEGLGALLLIAIVVGLVLILIRRGRPSADPIFAAGGWSPPTGAHSFGNAMPPPSGDRFGPVGQAQPGPQRGTAVLERPRAGQRGYYCSWCGDHVAVGANVSHDCGPRYRPSLYCMNCGSTFDGAIVCPSCGSPKLQ